MAVNIAALSSNWKKLQQKLSEEKAAAPKPAAGTSPASTPQKRKQSDAAAATNGAKKSKTSKDLKRKRNEEHADTNGVKKTKTLSSTAFARAAGHKNAKMSSSSSSAVAITTRSTTATSANGATTETTTTTTTTTSTTLLPSDFPTPAAHLRYLSSLPFTPNLGFYPAASSSKLRYIALDCEMVGTGPPPHDDSQLARVSMTNYHGEVIYDTYVQPVMDVTDYRTAVSGIRPEHLRRDVARPFKEVQADVERLLDGRILVGHAVHHDLAALLLSHPQRDIRDTSRYAKYKALAGGRTPALKKLARELLGLEIQTGEHSSVEDARATMALYVKEKDGFERDVVKRFGRPKAITVAEADEDEELKRARAEKRKAKLAKKKKKKKGKK